MLCLPSAPGNQVRYSRMEHNDYPVNAGRIWPFNDSHSPIPSPSSYERRLDTPATSLFNRHAPLHFSSSDQLVPAPLRARRDSAPSLRPPAAVSRSYPGPSQLQRSTPAIRSSFESDKILSASPMQSRNPPAPFQTQRQARRHSYRESTFSDESDVHLFAQALSGLIDGGDVIDAPQMPPPNRSYPTLSSHRQDVPCVNHDTNHQIQYNTLLTPNIHILPPNMDDEQQPHFRFSPSRSQPPSPISVADAMMGLSEPDVPPPEEIYDDDELPDYWQSQREATERARRTATGRAAELERRWASSRGN